MKHLFSVLLLFIFLTSCGDKFEQNTNSDISCYHECSFLISSNEPGEYNLYTCNGEDLTDQLYLSEPLGLFGDLTICTGPGFHIRALVGIDSYDGEASASFDNWSRVTITEDCMDISLPAAQFNHVISVGVELLAIIEVTESGSSSEMDNVSPEQMDNLVKEYRENLCN